MSEVNYMNSQPLVSVCIQTYQHKDFISASIESALMQKTSFSFEIIIGEDDSTDGTRQICLHYAQKYPGTIRLFLRSESDKIYVKGKKTGRFNFLSNLAAATGKYIALLDGDDSWTDNRKLQKQVDFLEANSGVCLCTNKVAQHFTNGKVKLPANRYWREEDYILTIKDLAKENFISMSSIIFKRDCIHDLPVWYKELPFLDYALTLHIAQKGNIGFLKDIMTRYNIHKGGIWTYSRAPYSHIKLWDLYTLLALNFSGELKRAMEIQRVQVGKKLIHFYKTHLWYNSNWLANELGEKKFGDDMLLLDAFKQRKTPADYAKNIYNGFREIVRRIVKP